MICPDCDSEMTETNECAAYNRRNRYGEFETNEHAIWRCECGVERDTREDEIAQAEEGRERADEMKAEQAWE